MAAEAAAGAEGGSLPAAKDAAASAARAAAVGVAGDEPAGQAGDVQLTKCHRCQQERPFSEYGVMGDGTTLAQPSPFCRVCMFDEQLRTQVQELLAAQVVDSLPEDQGQNLGSPTVAVTAEQPPHRQQLAEDANEGQAPAGAASDEQPDLVEQRAPGDEAAMQQHLAAAAAPAAVEGAAPEPLAQQEPHDAHDVLAADGSQLHHGQLDPDVTPEAAAALMASAAAAAGLPPEAAAMAAHLLPHMSPEQAAAHHAAMFATAAAAAQGLDPHAQAHFEIDPHAAAAAAAATAAAMAAAAAAAAAVAQDTSTQLDPVAIHHHIHAAAMHAAMQLDPATAALSMDPQQFAQLLHDGGAGLAPEAYHAFYQQQAAAAAAAAAAMSGLMAHPAFASMGMGGMFGAGAGADGEEVGNGDGATVAKTCTKCKLDKPLHEFPELRGKKRGRAAQCNDCKAALEENRKRRAEAPQLSDGHAGSHPCHPADPAAAACAVPAALMAMDPAAVTPIPAMEVVPVLTEKQCMHCMLVKPVNLFRRSKNKTDKLQNRCKECETLLGRGTKRDRSGPVVVKVSHKLCRRCNVDKEAGQFFQSKLSLDGLCTYCKACQKELNKLARAKRPDVPRPEVTMKKCRHCKEDRPADQYFKSKMNLDGLYSYCKSCATVLNSASKKRRRAELRAQKQATRQGGAQASSQGGSEATSDPAAAASYEEVHAAAAGDAAAAAGSEDVTGQEQQQLLGSQPAYAPDGTPAGLGDPSEAAATAAACAGPEAQQMVAGQEYAQGSVPPGYEGMAGYGPEEMAAAAAAAAGQSYEQYAQAAARVHEHYPEGYYPAEGYVPPGYDPAAMAATGHYDASYDAAAAEYHNHALAAQQGYDPAGAQQSYEAAGAHYDPATGQHFDPATGQPYDASVQQDYAGNYGSAQEYAAHYLQAAAAAAAAAAAQHYDANGVPSADYAAAQQQQYAGDEYAAAAQEYSQYAQAAAAAGAVPGHEYAAAAAAQQGYLPAASGAQEFEAAAYQQYTAAMAAAATAAQQAGEQGAQVYGCEAGGAGGDAPAAAYQDGGASHQHEVQQQQPQQQEAYREATVEEVPEARQHYTDSAVAAATAAGLRDAAPAPWQYTAAALGQSPGPLSAVSAHPRAASEPPAAAGPVAAEPAASAPAILGMACSDPGEGGTSAMHAAVGAHSHGTGGAPAEVPYGLPADGGVSNAEQQAACAEGYLQHFEH